MPSASVNTHTFSQSAEELRMHAEIQMITGRPKYADTLTPKHDSRLHKSVQQTHAGVWDLKVGMKIHRLFSKCNFDLNVNDSSMHV